MKQRSGCCERVGNRRYPKFESIILTDIFVLSTGGIYSFLAIVGHTPLSGGNVTNSTYRRVRGKCDEFSTLIFTNS